MPSLRSLLRYTAMPRCCRFFASPRREGARILAEVCNRRATPKRRKSSATRRARAPWAVWRRCSLLSGHCGHARRSRLATHPKALSRGVVVYFSRLLTWHPVAAARLATLSMLFCSGEVSNTPHSSAQGADGAARFRWLGRAFPAMKYWFPRPFARGSGAPCD